MKKYLPLVFSLGVLLIYGGIVKFQNPLREIEQIISLGLLLLLSMLVLLPTSQKDDKSETGHANAWVASASVFFCILAILIIYVNPHGRYPWQNYSFTTSGAHFKKLNLYNQLDPAPQVIILGSSRSFTIPSDYLAQNFDAPVFNMAIGGAGPVDELAALHYVLDHNPQPPSLFLVEIVATDLGTRAWQYYMPVSLVPYLTFDQKMAVVQSVFRDTLSFRSLSDAIFLFAGFDTGGEIITFLPDGTGVRKVDAEDVKFKDYKNSVNEQTPAVYKQNACIKLDEVGMQSIEKMVALSEQHGFSIVFYRSPLNIAYFEMVDLEKPAYKKCQALFNDFIYELAEKHPSIQYVDLYHYPPVSDLQRKGYIDVQHLSPSASKLVIDALQPALEHGLRYQEQNK